MKNIFLISLVFLFVVNVASAQLLTNEGFEGNYINTAPGWNEITWGNSVFPDVEYQRDSLLMHGGNASQKIIVRDLGDGATLLSQNFDFTAGTIYEGHIWLRSDIPMRVKFMFQERVPYYFVPAAYIADVTPVWQKYSIKGGYRRNTENNQTTIQGRFVIQPLDTGTFNVDDASLADITINEWNAQVADTGVIPKSYFGMHVNKLGVHQTYPAVNFGTMRLWSTGTEWEAIEPMQGILTDPANWIYDTTGTSGFGFRLDYYTVFINTHDSLAEIIYTMGQTPSWSAAFPDMPPSNISDWQNYVSIIGNRYNNKIKNWEVWNEADYSGFYSGTMTELISLAQVAYAELKNINSSNNVIAPNFTSAEGIANFLQAGGSAYADMFSWHHYPSKIPEESIAEITGIKNVMDNYGLSSAPLWNTEGAVSFPSTDTLSQEESMAAVSRSYILQWAFGIKNFNWFCWDVFYDFAHNFVPLSYSATPNQYDSITSSGIAYRETANWLIGSRMLNKNVTNDTWTIELELQDGTHAWIIWNTSGTQTFSIPGQWNVTHQNDLYGDTLALSSSNISISPMPLLLHSGIVSADASPSPDFIFSVSPNPATKKLSVKCYPSIPISQISISNLMGEKIYVFPPCDIKQEATIDVSNFSNGVYFILVLTEKGESVRKVIIQK